MTKIEWTEETWNPIRARDSAGTVGWHCERVSEGCVNCYAETINQKRFGTGLPYNRRSRDLVEVLLDESTLQKPLSWRKPRRVFVCSMTDLFGEWVSDEMLDRIFAVMALTPHITYQVLTKRPERMRAFLSERPYGMPDRNIWLGVSAENQHWADVRIPELLATPAAVRFLSCEPLLGAVELGALNLSPAKHSMRSEVWKYLDALTGATTHYVHGERTEVSGRGIDWVIVGGESGAGARPCDVGWIRSIVAQCQAAGVAVFVKQLGRCPVETKHELRPPGLFAPKGLIASTVPVKVPLKLSDRKGGDMSEWPEDLRVREMPAVGR